jgi:hypothetical protein
MEHFERLVKFVFFDLIGTFLVFAFIAYGLVQLALISMPV